MVRSIQTVDPAVRVDDGRPTTGCTCGPWRKVALLDRRVHEVRNKGAGDADDTPSYDDSAAGLDLPAHWTAKRVLIGQLAARSNSRCPGAGRMANCQIFFGTDLMSACQMCGHRARISTPLSMACINARDRRQYLDSAPYKNFFAPYR